MTTTNEKAAPGWNPDTACFDNISLTDINANATANKAVERRHHPDILTLQAREFEAAAELQKVCSAIGAQAGAMAVMAMASTLAKASAARMVAEREVRS